MNLKEKIHVAVGVIKSPADKILISKRHKNAHQGNLWEFPGGKVEAGETVQEALNRELKEELNIGVLNARPLIKINHHYSDLSVMLDVWTVEKYIGEASACEAQPIQWVDIESLPNFDFPAANLPIISAIIMPNLYAILNGNQLENLQADLRKILALNIKLIQLRAKNLSRDEIITFLDFARPLCKFNHTALLLNSEITNASQLASDGLHLTSAHLKKLTQKPDNFKWVSASCHTLQELQWAEQHGLNFALLGPVLQTQSHPDAEPLGWENFAELVQQVNIPVFALGGLNLNSLETAYHFGAQGIAGIRAFLD